MPTCLLCLFLLPAGGCSKAKGPGQALAAPDVEVVAVEQSGVPIYDEWIGTLDGMVNAEIKSKVSGYLLSQHYIEVFLRGRANHRGHGRASWCMIPGCLLYSCIEARLLVAVARAMILLASRSHNTELPTAAHRSQSMKLKLTVENACCKNGT